MRIGLTGGIAAGKSTVAARLRELGAVVIDYDELSREVVAPGSAGLKRIVDAFGPAAVRSSGELDRPWMAERVFGPDSEGARRRLDAIVHPLVEQRALQIESQIRDRRIIVHDVPLLAEVLDTIPMHFHHIVTVEAPDEMRIARMVNVRHMTTAQAVARIAGQATGEQRRRIADVVIDAGRPIEQMFDCVDTMYRSWVRELGR